MSTTITVVLTVGESEGIPERNGGRCLNVGSCVNNANEMPAVKGNTERREGASITFVNHPAQSLSFFNICCAYAYEQISEGSQGRRGGSNRSEFVGPEAKFGK